MTMTRAQALVLLEPKISTLWNDSFTRRPSEWQRFVNVRTTQKATVTDQNMTMFGGFHLKPEAQNISYDDWIIGNSKQYSPVRFALGYRVTYEMRKNDLYGQVDRLEGGLLDSARDTQEQTAALIFNNGFGTTDDTVVHAEANAILKVASTTQSCEGATLYLTMSPCRECSKLIHQAGIRRVVYATEYKDLSGVEFLRKAGVEVELATS